MANERMYPILPCRELDESITFYESLGFKRTYRQLRPNPYAVVALDEMQIHLAGIDGFNPEDSYGSVIIAVPDPDGLYRDFASKLRATYVKLPVTGIPRLTRPRKNYGTISGFSVVDPGGNWLRIYKLGDSEQAAAAGEEDGLAGIINVAARLGDVHGDETLALKTLESGIKRFPQATAVERMKAFLYRAELAVRTKNVELARSPFELAKSIERSDDERTAVADEFAHVEALLSLE